ncbi:flippase [Bifidobacterium adolescentis]|uniref:flippase n=1 Tax=Bifidobacterium adolescentis TaxID=1680 RepID=UPI003D7B6295
MKEKSLKKNFIYNFLYQLLAIAVPLVTSPYLARTLGAENIGIASWTNSIVFYFGMFIVLGVENYGNREIAYVRTSREERSKKFWSIYACQLINFIIILLLYLFYVNAIAKEYKVIFAILTMSLLTNGLDIAWFFYGMEEFKVTVVRNSVVKIVTLIAIFLLVHNLNDLWKYVAINSAGALIGQLTLWPNIKKHVDFYLPKRNEVIKNIKPLWILFIPVLAISVFTYMDKYMIGCLSNVVQNGYYENADKIISVPKAFITTIGTVMLPRTAHLLSSNRINESRRYIELSMTYTVMIGSALTFGLASVADVFSVVFWGQDFRACGLLIQGLAPAVLFSVIGSVIRSQFLIPHARDKEYTVSLIIGAIVNFCMNLIMIPKLGAFGAVIGTLCSEIALTCIQVFCVRKELPLKKYCQDCYMFVIIGMIMCGVVYIIKKHFSCTILNLIILVLIGGIIYSGLTWMYLSLTKNKLAKEIRNQILGMARRK